MTEFEKRLADYFTASELAELVVSDMPQFIAALEDFGFLTDEVRAELEEIMDE